MAGRQVGHRQAPAGRKRPRQHPRGKAPEAVKLPPLAVMGTMASAQSIRVLLNGANPSDGPSILRYVVPAVRMVQGPAAAHATTHVLLQAAPPLAVPTYSMWPRVR